MNDENSMDVEVPRNGTVIVEDGQVHDVREIGAAFCLCWCTNDKHHPSYRDLDQPRAGKPHPIGVQVVEFVWEV